MIVLVIVKNVSMPYGHMITKLIQLTAGCKHGGGENNMKELVLRTERRIQTETRVQFSDYIVERIKEQVLKNSVGDVVDIDADYIARAIEGNEHITDIITYDWGDGTQYTIYAADIINETAFDMMWEFGYEITDETVLDNGFYIE